MRWQCIIITDEENHTVTQHNSHVYNYTDTSIYTDIKIYLVHQITVYNDMQWLRLEAAVGTSSISHLVAV